jgi:hypothetical protein
MVGGGVAEYRPVLFGGKNLTNGKQNRGNVEKKKETRQKVNKKVKGNNAELGRNKYKKGVQNEE